MSNQIPHVLILGGGFGGLSAANEIRSHLSSSQVRITIIDKKDWFMIGFVKLWIIQGTRTLENAKHSLNSITKKGIDFVNEEIINIDLQNKTVNTSSKELHYDYLIIAIGAELAPEKISGLEKNSMIIYDHNQTPKIHDAVNKMKSGRLAIAIMGMPYKCPPAPFEASLIISSILKKNGTRNSIQIDFYSPVALTLPAAGPEVSKQVLDMINAENIQFHELCKTTSVESKKLIFEKGTAEFDLLLTIPPHQAPNIIYESGLAQEGEFIQINRDCKTSFENVYAIGDVTNMMVTEKMAMPKAGVFAEGEGLTIAKNIVSQIKNEQEYAEFDGKGGCFIESGSDSAALVQVEMFAEPNPKTQLTESTPEHMKEKIQFEEERIEKWL